MRQENMASATQRAIFLAAALIGIIGAIFYLESSKAPRIIPPQSSVEAPAAPIAPRAQSALPGASAPDRAQKIKDKAAQYPAAHEFVSPSGFINTDKIKIADLIGKKVILLDFWTYSCINCVRTIPYLNAWWQKYKDKGLVIVGVHTPEFEFEKNEANVAAAVKKFNIQYPVVMDNDYGTWSAYQNQYWPREYLIDIDGFIVHDHIGEGAYDETERAIQQALTERMAVAGVQEKIDTALAAPGAASAPQSGSPEIYFGASRNGYLSNGAAHTGGIQHFSAPPAIAANALYLSGDWNFEKEFAENQNAGAKIIFKYASRDVYFVASAKDGAKIKVLRDGKPLDAAVAGDDVSRDGSGAAIIKEDRLYKLIHDSAYGEHAIEIIIESPGLRAFTFTFG